MLAATPRSLPAMGGKRIPQKLGGPRRPAWHSGKRGKSGVGKRVATREPELEPQSEPQSVLVLREPQSEPQSVRQPQSVLALQRELCPVQEGQLCQVQLTDPERHQKELQEECFD